MSKPFQIQENKETTATLQTAVVAINFGFVVLEVFTIYYNITSCSYGTKMTAILGECSGGMPRFLLYYLGIDLGWRAGGGPLRPNICIKSYMDGPSRFRKSHSFIGTFTFFLK